LRQARSFAAEKNAIVGILSPINRGAAAALPSAAADLLPRSGWASNAVPLRFESRPQVATFIVAQRMCAPPDATIMARHLGGE
jgi:hypothetical protein